AETVSFNFNSFSEGNPAINFQGDVTVLGDGTIQLHTLNKVVLYIWSSATGNVAFTTVIYDYDPADGFIAPEDTQIPAGSGGNFKDFDEGAGHVGVQFDTYDSNSEYNDPPTDHVGIDVNSVDSVKTAHPVRSFEVKAPVYVYTVEEYSVEVKSWSFTSGIG
nr:agglutinin [Arachis hypogaea]